MKITINNTTTKIELTSHNWNKVKQYENNNK